MLRRDFKRKQRDLAAGKVVAIYRPRPTKRRRLFTPGRDRVGGFYGRYSGRSGGQKFLDPALTFDFDQTLEVPATGQLVLIPQGVTESERVGRKCTIRSVQIRGVINHTPGASALSSGTAYLWLVQDLQANGAAAAASGNGGVMTTTAAQTAHINLSESSRFRILKKWAIDMAPAAGATTAFNNTTKHIEFYKKCTVPLEFSSTTGAIGEIRSNNLFLLAGSSGAGVIDDLIKFSGSARVRFSDQD